MSALPGRAAFRLSVVLVLALVVASCSGSDPYSKALASGDQMRASRYLDDPLLKKGVLLENGGPDDAWSVDLARRPHPIRDVLAIARRAPWDVTWYSISCYEQSVSLIGFEQVAGHQSRIELDGDGRDGSVRFQLYFPTRYEEGINPEWLEELQFGRCDPGPQKQLRAFAQEVGIQPGS
jgi:hypothetical protein